MEMLQYQGQNVYTSSLNLATLQDLEKAKTGLGRVCDAYFFQLSSDRVVERVNFNKARVDAQKVGLMVEVKSQFGGQASVAIAGLDRIIQFLYDTASVGNLSVLKDRTVTEYTKGMQLLGIGI